MAPSLSFPTLRLVLALALLAGTTVLAEAPAPWIGLIVLGLVLLILLPSLPSVLRTVTGRFAAAQVAVTIALLVGTGQGMWDAVVPGMRFSGVAAFLICMPLYAVLFRAGGLDRWMARTLLRVRGGLRVPALLACATVSTFGLSFGTIPVYGSALPGGSRPAAAALSRGIVISMLLAPTTGSVAAVMAAYPTLGLPVILSATGPVAAFAFALGCLFRHGSVAFAEATPNRKRTEPTDWTAPVLVAILLIGLLGLGVSLLPAIAWSGVVTYLVWMRFQGRGRRWRRAVAGLRGVMNRSAARLAPEIMLFVATGWLAWALSGLTLPSDLGAPDAGGLLRPALPAVILVAMAGIAMLGVHPMVVFGILHPLVAQIGTGLPPAAEYTVWLIGFVLALLLAPISVLTMTAAITSGLTPWQASVRLHGVYALCLGAGTVAYVVTRYG
ncbi:hypothetical protein [Roseospira visakhapatnamensis]|uniref:Uncharacterized protein n=1 Tax=Roseospira visakhapatnamensis TaxID=390880 RepID=A0A7W6RAR1_9PROT|nr:hypothetical protein [Roseospira visakhapatnamensis]MBB4264479.1 hypothetical protein [Roseospira visakhapatnamensis]